MTLATYTGNVPNRLSGAATFSADADYYHQYFAAFIPQFNFDITALNTKTTTGVSTTTNTISTGTKTFTVSPDKNFQGGMFVVLADSAAPSTNSVVGQVTSYNSTTGVMVVEVLASYGSGTKSDWIVSQTGVPASGAVDAGDITGTVAIANGGTGATTAGGALTALGLSADTGASLIGFKQSGVGAVSRTLDARNKDWKSIYDFNVVGNGIANDTVGVQAAIDSGYDIDFFGGSFAVNNLTQSAAGQCLYSSSGFARLIKNANGAIITSTGNDVIFKNILGQGDSATPVYTGDGIVATGQRPQFLGCGCRWVAGRALKATGGRIVVKNSGDIWQTTDTSVTGFDVEIGQSGTATLYHELDDIYTGQSTGGVLLTDTGSQTIKGGLFGKLSIVSGTSPSGVNGGKTIGARILGDITVGLSGAIFTGNQFGSVVMTLQAGTGKCSVDASNTREVGFSIVNSGNLSTNLIVTQIGTSGGSQLRVGDDTSTSSIQFNPSDLTASVGFSGSTTIPNTRAYRAYMAGGTLINLASITAGDVLNFGSTSSARMDLNGPSINVNTTSGTQAQFVDGAFRPFSTNTKTLGTASLKWNQSYVTTMFVGSGTAQWTSGAGTPEGSLTAVVGSMYTRTDGGAVTTLYVKESGTGNTGWVAK